MTATETFEQLDADFEKTLIALLGVKSIDAIHYERRLPGYVYHQDKALHEYWIALGQYSVSSNLSLLAFVINAKEPIVSVVLKSKQDIVNYCNEFKRNSAKVIEAFDFVIGKPNMVFIGYSNPITMEEYLQKIVSKIHSEALNLEYNYKQFKMIESSLKLN